VESILLILLLVMVVAAVLRSQSASFKGAVGENRVNASLRSRLDGQAYRLLADLTLPTKDGTTQIDHVVLSRYGIFVIETKNMSGWIFGSADQSQWTQVFHRHKSRFQNPLRQNYHHLKVLQETLGVDMRNLHNVVVFVGSAEPKTKMPPNVVWGVRPLSAYIKSKREPVFSASEVRSFEDRLVSSSLENNRQTRRNHVQHVKAKVRMRQNDIGKCPRCNANMTERSNRQSSQKFLGCTRYPKCKGTRIVL
jgi:restriction system protein